MNRKTACRAALSLLFLGVATTSPSQQTHYFYGAGLESCGSWTAMRRLEKTSNYYADVAWIQGFLSAAGAYFLTAPRETDADAIDGFVDNYCRDHPLEKLSLAAHALVNELGGRPYSLK